MPVGVLTDPAGLQHNLCITKNSNPVILHDFYPNPICPRPFFKIEANCKSFTTVSKRDRFALFLRPLRQLFPVIFLDLRRQWNVATINIPDSVFSIPGHYHLALIVASRASASYRSIPLRPPCTGRPAISPSPISRHLSMTDLTSIQSFVLQS